MKRVYPGSGLSHVGLLPPAEVSDEHTQGKDGVWMNTDRPYHNRQET